jgi:hypothetical protein
VCIERLTADPHNDFDVLHQALPITDLRADAHHRHTVLINDCLRDTPPGRWQEFWRCPDPYLGAEKCLRLNPERDVVPIDQH